MTAQEKFNKRGASTIQITAYTSYASIPVQDEPIEITFVNDNGSRKYLRVVMDAREARSLGNDLLRHAANYEKEQHKTT